MNSKAAETWPQTEPAELIRGDDERPLTIRFSGSGSEYFRIWIVNLLLSIVTLSLYRPWAKVRRLKYFYGNTLVDEHALDFHGDPRKMLRGYLLVGAMAFAYSTAGRFSPLAALVAVVAVGLLWPALLRASMQFRLANTSWRGLRFRFSGDLAGAYKALLPMLIPAIALVLVGSRIDDHEHPLDWYLTWNAAVIGGTVLLAPLVWWNLKRYQHDHYGIGDMQTRLALGPWRLYGLGLRVVLLVVLAILGMVAVGAILGVIVGSSLRGVFSGHPLPAVFAVFGVVMVAVVWLLILLVPVPYATSRLQNLVWSNTRAEALRFDSNLRFGPLLTVTLKNWILMVLTLGLYWPFAEVATYRLRVEAITPRLRADLERLHDRTRSSANDASGDAAGDLFGIDIGF